MRRRRELVNRRWCIEKSIGSVRGWSCKANLMAGGAGQAVWCEG